MRSSRHSETPATPPLDWRLRVTAEDRAALRAARLPPPGSDPFAVLMTELPFPQPPRRTTAAGRRPFRLDPPATG